MIPALQGYCTAIEESLAATGELASAADQLQAVADLVNRSSELALALNDGSVPVANRRAVLRDLLEGRVRPEVQRLVDRAVTVAPASEAVGAIHWLARRVAATAAGEPSPEDDEVLGRLAARNRVAGYAAAVFEQVDVPELEEIEDQLFRFARTVESHRDLRIALGDRSLPVAVRTQVVDDLLAGQALPSTRRLAAYAVRGGRARDIVASLDALVEAAAQARGWRVARVRSAEEVDPERRRALGDALGQLTGGPVELQVTLDPALLGGVVVQVGDVLVDGSTRHRLDRLKEYLLDAEAANRLPEGRETADG